MISIVIPARNEAAVIARTLKGMVEGAAPDELDIIVVCNGCTDDTAAIARGFGQPVRVIETAFSSKTHALNLGDEEARAFPRIYVDADVLVTISAIRALAERLQRGDVLAVAPHRRLDLNGCSWAVRAYFDIARRLPAAQQGFGGSGVYALSEAGRRRFGKFPDITADDAYVRVQFKPHDRETVASTASTVFPPRTLRNVIAIKARAQYGNLELARLLPELWTNMGQSNHTALVGLLRKPSLWPGLFIYGLVTIQARRQARSACVQTLFYGNATRLHVPLDATFVNDDADLSGGTFDPGSSRETRVAARGFRAPGCSCRSGPAPVSVPRCRTARRPAAR